MHLARMRIAPIVRTGRQVALVDHQVVAHRSELGIALRIVNGIDVRLDRHTERQVLRRQRIARERGIKRLDSCENLLFGIEGRNNRRLLRLAHNGFRFNGVDRIEIDQVKLDRRFGHAVLLLRVLLCHDWTFLSRGTH